VGNIRQLCVGVDSQTPRRRRLELQRKRYPLRPRVMWKHWQDAETLIGVRFGKQTAYGLLDIDKGSDYLNETSVRDIFGALETIGITRPVVLRSSWSGGLHIYLPLPEPVGTFDLAVALKGTLEAQGFKVAEGQLECFPNTKTFGKHWLKQFVEYQGHRLPLQPGSGSTLLASYNLQPIGGELDRFWSHWDFAAQAVDMEMLRCAIAAGKANRRKHKRVWSKLHQWRSDLEHEISEGWTANGQTNQLLKAIATFGRVFVGLAGDDLAAYVSVIRPAIAPAFTSTAAISTKSTVRPCAGHALLRATITPAVRMLRAARTATPPIPYSPPQTATKPACGMPFAALLKPVMSCCIWAGHGSIKPPQTGLRPSSG
jgi:hypothetical protein